VKNAAALRTKRPPSFKGVAKVVEAMRNASVVAIDQDDVLTPHYLPAHLTKKFAVAERRRRRWIWTLILSTLLTMMGLVVWLVNRI